MSDPSRGIKRDCPEIGCGRPLKIVGKIPAQQNDARPSGVIVPPAAWVYECEEHGQFAINFAGEVTRLG